MIAKPTVSPAVSATAMSTVFEAPDSLEVYTRAVEDLCRSLLKSTDARHLLHVKGGSPQSVHDYSGTALNRWELALDKLQKRKILLIAVIDGPLCDFSLSLSLACDLRLGTANASLPKPVSGGEHMPLPLWWLASIGLHVGAHRAQQLLWRRKAVTASELLELKVLNHATLGPKSEDMLSVAYRLPVHASVPLDLLRRVVLQGFSIAGADQIGHSLAVSSLVIAEAVGSAMASGPKLPELRPHPFALTQSSTDAWTLELTGSVSRALASPPTTSSSPTHTSARG